MGRPIGVTIEDEREFQVALEQYKRRSGRQFPTWSEILEILGSIGYAKRIWRPVDAWSLSSNPDAERCAIDRPAGMVGCGIDSETPVLEP